MSARQLTYSELSTTASRLYTDTQVQIVLSESGKSAYELAVKNGFVGTEIDWLASLVGSAGIDGLSAYATYTGSLNINANLINVNVKEL
jgi:hypothetical protein